MVACFANETKYKHSWISAELNKWLYNSFWLGYHYRMISIKFQLFVALLFYYFSLGSKQLFLSYQEWINTKSWLTWTYEYFVASTSKYFFQRWKILAKSLLQNSKIHSLSCGGYCNFFLLKISHRYLLVWHWCSCFFFMPKLRVKTADEVC